MHTFHYNGHDYPTDPTLVGLIRSAVHQHPEESVLHGLADEWMERGDGRGDILRHWLNGNRSDLLPNRWHGAVHDDLGRVTTPDRQVETYKSVAEHRYPYGWGTPHAYTSVRVGHDPTVSPNFRLALSLATGTSGSRDFHIELPAHEAKDIITRLGSDPGGRYTYEPDGADSQRWVDERAPAEPAHLSRRPRRYSSVRPEPPDDPPHGGVPVVLSRRPRRTPTSQQQVSGMEIPVRMGRAPADEVNGITEGQRSHGTYTTNNHNDLVLADKLADHDDPLETVVRRDLSYRPQNPVGNDEEDNDYLTSNLCRHLDDLAGAGSPVHDHPLTEEFTNHSLHPNGHFSYRGYGDDGTGNALAYELGWYPPGGSYVAALAPHEMIHLLNEHGVPHDLREPWQDDDPPGPTPTGGPTSPGGAYYTRHRKRRQGQVRRYANYDETPGVPHEEEPDPALEETAWDEPEPEEEPDETPWETAQNWHSGQWSGLYRFGSGATDRDTVEDALSETGHLLAGLPQHPNLLRLHDHLTELESTLPPRPDEDEETESNHYTRRLSSKVRYAAYRAPAGGMVSRGTHQPGGQFTPDMEGEFMRAASKLTPQQQVPTVSYAPKDFPAVDTPKADVTTGRRRRRRRKVEAAVEKPDVTKLTKDRCPGTTSVETKLSRRSTMTPLRYSTHDRSSFEAHIRDNPDDAHARLVYADWLDENGFPDEAKWQRVDANLMSMELTDHGEFVNGRVRSHTGKTYNLGGGTVHTEESADADNERRGLQTRTHPDMYWPGASNAGDFEPYEGWENGDVSGFAADHGLGDEDEDELVSRIQDASRSAHAKM